MEKFCSLKEVYDLVEKETGFVDPIFFERTKEMFLKKNGSVGMALFTEDEMDLPSFLLFTRLLATWYPNLKTAVVANFIDKKYKEKYELTKADVLGAISKAMNTPAETEEMPKATPKKAVQTSLPAEDDMYKVVQNALKKGMTRVAIQEKYNLTQREITLYEGYEYWSEAQKADHKAMLEYRRLHPESTDTEAITAGCRKPAVGYRYSLVPTKEQQEAYNRSVTLVSQPKERPIAKPVKRSLKNGGDIKSLILSDKEREEQQALYSKIKEIADARNCAPRDISTLFKARLTKDYGIVIDQIKKELMLKYRINHGEGKAPNALEAIVMSEYLPIAKSVLDDMLTESFTVK